MLTRTGRNRNNGIIIEGDNLAEFRRHIMSIRASMEETTPKVYANQLNQLLDSLKENVSDEQFETLTIMATQMQEQQLEIYYTNKNRSYEMMKLGATFRIRDKEALKELATEGIMVQKTKQQTIDKISIFLPALLTSIGTGYAISKFKNDIVASLSGYSSYFTGNCSIVSEVPGYFTTTKVVENVDSAWCNYIGPALNFGIGGLADKTAGSLDSAGGFAVYMIVILLFMLSTVIFKALTVKRAGFSSVDFGEKKKSSRKSRKPTKKSVKKSYRRKNSRKSVKKSSRRKSSRKSAKKSSHLVYKNYTN